MNTMANTEREVVREQIEQLQDGPLSVLRVDIDERDDAYGEAVVVTITIVSSESDLEWDEDAFVSIRSAARRIAVSQLHEETVRVVYTADVVGPNEPGPDVRETHASEVLN
ncbi:hypothetical protein [Curtobacterium sp. MCBD17_013]|uniref:hypothetical protein n=1 Tax=Curtobacterium sp. MCBD17_013 TaxID=2175668 RepID=UPI0015E8D026|nr:hypothetical protein [Curtobacterium sp. MCBD17_013]